MKLIMQLRPRRYNSSCLMRNQSSRSFSYRRILGHFDPSISTDITIPPSPQEQRLSIPIIGFSATFGRHDGLSLGSVFDKIVYHRDFLQMIKEHWYVSS